MALPDGPGSRIVLIGSAAYRHDDLPPLPAVRNNLTDLAAALTDPQQGWLDEAQCTLVPDPRTAADVVRALRPSVLEAEDLLLVYYAGHGIVEDTDYYLAVTETDPEEPSISALPYRTLRKVVLGARARNRVVVIDACWSGMATTAHMAGGQERLRTQTAIEGAFVLASSEHDSTSLAPVGERFTAFTKELIGLLQDGSSRLGPELTLDNVYQHLLHELTAAGRPRPTRTATNTAARLVIARNRGYRPDTGSWRADRSGHAGHPALREGRLLLDEEERAGHVGGYEEAADGYAAVAQVLSRLFGPKDELAEAAQHSRAFWAARRAAVVAAVPPPPEQAPLTGFRTVGIELGPGFCTVATLEGDRVEIVPNAEGAERTPAVVAFTGATGDSVLVGAPAVRQELRNASGTFRLAEAGRIGAGELTLVDGAPVTAERVLTELLRKVKRDTEDRLGERVARAVVAVPAATSEAERRRIQQACRTVGVEPLRLVSASLAAGMAFDRQMGGRESTLLVVGLEATSLEVAVVEVGSGVTFVNAIALTDGLGSEGWVTRLANDLLKDFESRHGVRLAADREVNRRVRQAAGTAVEELRSVGETTVRVPYLANTPAGPATLEATVTREQYDRITAGLRSACAETVERMLTELWRGDRAEIEHVLLVGAGSRIPGLVDLVRGSVGRQGVNVVAMVDTQLAVGAMLHAGMMTGVARDVLGVDILARAIGIESQEGRMTVLVPASTGLPTRRSAMLTTSSEDQPAVNINVYQGEEETAARNVLLASLRLSGLPLAPPGLLQIEVTVDIDANGEILVSARDFATGRSETLTDITGSAPPTVPLFGDLPAEFRPPDPVGEEPPRQQQKQS
ncbi:Molecular chaperone DnaK (HSP70) [Streptomyces sp. TLI_053]|uniref:caspase, EACC1-associated type n=1 Tax=Streptomyces sp. TLI_053 TaxID=1855352 RepID=UPI00087CE233|nr:Hsp70 family protein [Streptomyces sp. TLI_053]SDT80952.1 Molecular chaperone DnaK (HSP70) [Streptomyces sp. TLI_053]